MQADLFFQTRTWIILKPFPPFAQEDGPGFGLKDSKKLEAETPVRTVAMITEGNMMSYEVELKFAVTDVPQLLEKLEQFGLCFGEAVEEHDTFYQHPAKDYAATDECLRIRYRAGEYRITYKGPKVDRETKTRQEIELFLADNAKTARQWDQLLQALGFRVAAELKKMRRTAGLVYQEQKYELSLDHIDGLGDFIELETIANAMQLDDARCRILSLAETLELTQPITASYLELSQAEK